MKQPQKANNLPGVSRALAGFTLADALRAPAIMKPVLPPIAVSVASMITGIGRVPASEVSAPTLRLAV